MNLKRDSEDKAEISNDQFKLVFKLNKKNVLYSPDTGTTVGLVR